LRRYGHGGAQQQGKREESPHPIHDGGGSGGSASGKRKTHRRFVFFLSTKLLF